MTRKDRPGATDPASPGDGGKGQGGPGGPGRFDSSLFDNGGEPPRGTGLPPADATTFGLKIFLVSLTMLFGATLLGYVITRVQASRWEDFQVEGLNRSLAVSTVLIVFVSAAMHWAVQSIRYDRRERLKAGLLLALLLAVLFLFNQFGLWTQLFDRLAEQQRSVAVGEPEGGDLSAFLFVAMTVLHALHVIGGFVPLGWVLTNAFQDRYSGASFRGVWNCAMYWHFIDIVWILMAIALASG